MKRMSSQELEVRFPVSLFSDERGPVVDVVTLLGPFPSMTQLGEVFNA